ncbi:glycoside hydrolase family 79 protein [Crucibulum laeve]|uniref:Glycoside hydrolase family 79 protein n=1 Tax=Crucibulum laeve TaxID=68775 RepID=A0A5C3LTS4_9AGAR|nr:glycoside hydrolase family 79 protein [Crucibulum laeve]
MFVSFCTSLLIELSIFATLATSLDVTISVTAPTSAATISTSLVSFSLEQDRWTDFSGTTARNQFFFNVLDNLKQLTGSPPNIRIGADSEDHTNFNPNVQFSQTIFPAISSTFPYPEATNITVGDTYYQTAKFLPPGTHVVWGVNFGQNNITAATLEATSIAKAFKTSDITNAGISLDAIEIGNEADLYKSNGDRASSYTSTQYTKEWTTFATQVISAAGITSSSHTKLWGAAFAGSSTTTTGFSPQAIFSEGILSSTPGALISTISQHHYSGSFCSGSGGLLQDLMTKSTIRGNLTTFKPDITATRAKGLDYVLGETNSYSCHGAPGVSNAAGAAIWGLDYLLFATQIGISKVFFHEGIGYKYNAIQPATLTRSITDGSTLSPPLAPHVQPLYYAAVIAAEAIGNSGNTHSVELALNDTSISGYGFYEGTKLVRAVLINSKAFLKADTSARTTTHINLKFTGTAPTKATVKRLAIGRADDTSGVKWGGQTYETSDGRASGAITTQSISVADGVDISETEVIMLSFT